MPVIIDLFSSQTLRRRVSAVSKDDSPWPMVRDGANAPPHHEGVVRGSTVTLHCKTEHRSPSIPIDFPPPDSVALP